MSALPTSPDDADTVSADYEDRFRRVVKVKAIKVKPHQVQSLTTKFKEHRYGRKGVRPVVDLPSGEKAWLMADGPAAEKALASVEGERVEVPVELTAKNYTATEILEELLPEGMTVPSSFEGVGHIAHLNLKDEHRRHRFLIGKVILDKNPGIRTVVNKLGTIGTIYREFHFELLAGVADYNATLKQHGCTFKFAYDKVYWNSRLQTEHTRLVNLMPKSDILCDVMGGVGPFAVPAAKKGLKQVHCNDLNPASYAAMQENAELNRVKNMQCYNMDGRDFVRKMRDELLLAGSEDGCDVHFAMNLPATAVEFLDAFDGWDPARHACSRAVVHVYCFSCAEDLKADALAMAKRHLGAAAGGIADVNVHHVRNVAPKKEMMCVTFRLVAKSAAAKRTAPPEDGLQRAAPVGQK